MKNIGWETKDGGLAYLAKTNGDALMNLSGLAIDYQPDDGDDIAIPGLFQRSLEERPSVPLLYMHDVKQPIGKTVNLFEDPSAGGLIMSGFLVPTRTGQDAKTLVRHKVMTGLSIGYEARETHAVRKNGKTLRALDRVDLFEVSLVTFPMNRRARISAFDAKQAVADALLAHRIDNTYGTWGIPAWELEKYLSAYQRQLERLEHDGQTTAEWYIDFLCDVAALELELQRLST